jgi:putative transposase
MAWKGCLDDLVARGLRAPVLVIIDGNAGLRRAVGEVWARAAVQRCCIHKLRNLERKAPKHVLAEIRNDFHRIVYAANADAARAAYVTFERTWAKRCAGVTSLRKGGDELPTFFRFPKAQVEDPAHNKRDRAAPRRIPPAREDARLAAERRRSADPAL